MRSAQERRRGLPAGNDPAYVAACLRRGLRFRAAAVAISGLATALFGVALWLALHGDSLLGIDVRQAVIGCVCQSAATVFLALELRAARRDSRAED